MMAIIELFLLIVKTMLLSAIYSTIILLIILLLSKMADMQWAKRVLVKPKRFWLLMHFIISVLLMAVAFSYWQDTGLGDNSKIPIGYGQTVESEDFAWTYFYPDLSKTSPNEDELIIGNYKVADPFLCAAISHEFTNGPRFDFMVYDLRDGAMDTFYNEQEYTAYAAKHALPMPGELYDFRKHYEEFINNRPVWRKWLIP